MTEHPEGLIEGSGRVGGQKRLRSSLAPEDDSRYVRLMYERQRLQAALTDHFYAHSAAAPGTKLEITGGGYDMTTEEMGFSYTITMPDGSTSGYWVTIRETD